MKKILLTVIGLMLFGNISAQKITKSTVDKFNKSKHIETSWVNIRSNVMDNKDVNAMFYSFNGGNFLRFKINNTVTGVVQGAAILILDEDGESHNFEVFQNAISGKGEGATKIFGSALPGIDILSVGEMDFLADKLPTAVRINTVDGYVDYEISEDKGKKMQKAYQIYKKELDK